MNKKDFVEKYQEYYKNNNVNALIVTIKKPNYPRPEFVVVSKENQPIKIKEYLKEYNDDLELIRNQEIKIIDLNVFNIELIIGK